MMCVRGYKVLLHSVSILLDLIVTVEWIHTKVWSWAKFWVSSFLFLSVKG